MFELFVLAVLCVGGSSAAQSLGPAFAWGDAPLDGFASGQSAVYQVSLPIWCMPYIQEQAQLQLWSAIRCYRLPYILSVCCAASEGEPIGCSGKQPDTAYGSNLWHRPGHGLCRASGMPVMKLPACCLLKLRLDVSRHAVEQLCRASATHICVSQVNLRRLALGQPSESDKLLSAQTHSSSNSATFADVTAEVSCFHPYHCVEGKHCP